MLWSPDMMFAWYFWSIILLFSLFPNTAQFFFSLIYSSLISKNKGYKTGRMRPFFDDFFSKIRKFLIDPLRDPESLSGGLGYFYHIYENLYRQIFLKS